MDKNKIMRFNFKTIIILAVVTIIAIGSVMWIIPQYRVWQKELSGKAQLKEAEWNRQIKIKEAQAKLEAEKLNKQSEIIRAEGAAEAQRIIAQTITAEYIQWLWVQGLHDGNSEVIYVPTESNLPILEAMRGFGK